MHSHNVDDSGSSLARLKEQWDHPAVSNADNIGLGAAGRVGHVEEINGHEAAEMSEFVPTRHELVHLAKYWAEVALDIEYYWFCCQQVGSSDRRQESFARRRVSRIATLLGDAEVEKAVYEAKDKLGKKFGSSKYWDIFLHGMPEEKRIARDEIAEENENEARDLGFELNDRPHQPADSLIAAQTSDASRHLDRHAIPGMNTD